MSHLSQKRIRLANSIFWLLLVYMVAALLWWLISLENQNKKMTQLYKTAIENKNPSLPIIQFQNEISTIEENAKKNTIKYVGEGIAFLLFILMGAGFVYRSVRRQLMAQIQQQNFMMAVTHEFKTPISIAKLNLETLQKYSLDNEKKHRLIQTTLQEIARLNTLTNNILISSQIENSAYKISKEELNFSHLLKDCIQNFQDRYPERIFNEKIEPEIEIDGDPFLLQLMINNFLENAVQYSPKEKPIFCQLKAENKKAILNIIDEGTGIPTEEKKKIFGKFYRIGNEETRKTQGTGLGLYLCLKIATNHNADIFLTNNKPTGSNFAVSFHT